MAHFHKRRLISLLELTAAILTAVSGFQWWHISQSAAPKQVAYGVIGLFQMLFALVLCITSLFFSAFCARWMAMTYTFPGKALILGLSAALCIRDDSDLSVGLAVPIALCAALYVALTFIAAFPGPVPLLHAGVLDMPRPTPMAASDLSLPPWPQGTYGPTAAGPEAFALPPEPKVRVRTMDEAWSGEIESPPAAVGAGAPRGGEPFTGQGTRENPFRDAGEAHI